jgi:hypothetical protein
MKFVLIAVALLDDLRCGSKVGGAPRSGIRASGVGAVKETEICNLRKVAMSLLGTVVSGRRFSFSGQSHCRGDGDAVHGERVQAHLLCHRQLPQKALRRSLGKEFAKSMSHFTPNPMRSIPSRQSEISPQSDIWPCPTHRYFRPRGCMLTSVAPVLVGWAFAAKSAQL